MFTAWIVIVLLSCLLCALEAQSSESCGRSDSCSNSDEDGNNNDDQHSPYNYQYKTCELKWELCTVHGHQVPQPFDLCTSYGVPSGDVPVDFYTLALQKHGDRSYTLHGLWASSNRGNESRDQPYGCKNGEQFNEEFLDETFQNLFHTYWPTNHAGHNGMKCFILSEWMKHGTCAVYRDGSNNLVNIPQEQYYRTAFLLANLFNTNDDLQSSLDQSHGGMVNLSIDCVTNVYHKAQTWSGNTADSMPALSDSDIQSCTPCGDSCASQQPDNTCSGDDCNTDGGDNN